MMSQNQQEKLVLVTGTSRGIGKAIAQFMAKPGYTVIGTSTSDTGAAAITQNLSVYGSEHKGYALNLSDSDSIDALLANIKTDFGKTPDILINNAGITSDGLLARMKVENWDSVITANLTGVFKLTKACLPSMIKSRWGRIISIGSVVARMGNPGQANYCAAKAGVEGFSRALSKEVASRGITVNVIAPGFIQTDMTDKLSEKQVDAMLNQIPMKRMGATEDIAYAVDFLASEQSAYITGVTLPVNGGLYNS